MKTIYEIREQGRTFCQTEGSEHYKAVSNLEPMDLIIAKGLAEDFCLANIIKYAARFKQTQNLNDLKKASDYCQILVGVKLGKKEDAEKVQTVGPANGLKKEHPMCGAGYCENVNINNADKLKECQESKRKGSKDGWFEGCNWRIPFINGGGLIK